MSETASGGGDNAPFVDGLRAALREQRIRARRSQADVARSISCSRKRVSDFELGLCDPGLRFVDRLARELGVSLSFVPPDDPFEGA